MGEKNELRKIHERIATLEGQLHELDKPALHTPAWAWVFLGLVLGPMGAIVIGAFAFTIWIYAASPFEEAGHETEFTPPPPPQKAHRVLGVRWYPQPDVTPITTDVNGDGQDDLVGLAWGQSIEKSLHVVALDGKTFEPIWDAGGFRGTWHSDITHVYLVNDRVVATDTAGDIHVIEKTTGKEERTIAYPAGVEIACDAPKSDVLLVSSRRWGGHGVEAFDLSTGLAVAVPSGRTCAFHDDAAQKVIPGVPAPKALDEKRFKAPKDVFVLSAFDADAVTFASSRHQLSNGPDNEAYGVAWDTKTAKIAWQHSLMDTGDVEHENGRHTLVVDGNVITVYQAEIEKNPARKGPFRVVAWNVATGEKQWSTALPSSAEGSWLGAVGGASGRLFVVTDQGLHVLDPQSGAVLTTLERF